MVQKINPLFAVMSICLILLVACSNSTGDTPAQTADVSRKSAPLSQHPDFTFHVQNVFFGEAAKARVQNIRTYWANTGSLEVDEGWQWIAFDVIVENTSDENKVFGKGNHDWFLIDSGGYERRLVFNLRQGSGGASYDPVFVPGIRYRLPLYVKIPRNQTPSSLLAYFNEESLTLDFEEIIDDALVVPFESPPDNIPLADKGGMEYVAPGKYRVNYSDFGFRENEYGGSIFEARMTAENLGGHDIKDLSFYAEVGYPAIVGVTNQGEILQTNQTPFVYETVPPGFTKQTDGVFIFGLDGYPGNENWGDFEWVWVALVTGLEDGAQSIAQLQTSP